MKLIGNTPINGVSFGNVAINLLREFFNRNIELSFFPIGDKTDVSVYDKIDKAFVEYLQNATNSRFENLNKNTPSFKVWHISGSENRISKTQCLFTFHETSELTSVEKSILKMQDIIFVSSNYTKNVFESNGIQNVHFVPLGFDKDFGVTDKVYLPDKIHFGLLGKFENRKNTSRIIKSWLKLFGNNSKYQLTCAITNPFLDRASFQNEIMKILQGKNYNNINFIPFMQTNSEVNDYLNSIDIDLGGLSGAEGWNLPSFNATALGKWSVVLNATAHKDWATKNNSILIEPTRLKDSHDGVFFHKGSPVNQGCFYDISDEEMDNAILSSVKYAKTKNIEGLKLQEKFSYAKSADIILNIIETM